MQTRASAAAAAEARRRRTTTAAAGDEDPAAPAKEAGLLVTKGSLRAAGWATGYSDRLEALVRTVHHVTTHAHQLAWLVMISEAQATVKEVFTGILIFLQK